MEQPELVDEQLKDLKGMTPKIYRLLVEEGLTTIRRIAMSTVDDIAEIEGISDNKAKAIIYAAREHMGMCDFVAVDRIQENYEWFTTGSENVDDLMDGGITTGRLTELFGGFKSGKTNTVNTLCVTVQLPKDEGGLDGDVIYIDTEGTFSKAKIARIARRFGIDPTKALSRIHLAKVYSADHQVQMIENCEKLMGQYPIKLIIIDSLMALLRNEYVGIGALAKRQQKLNSIIHLLSQMAESYNLAVVMTNQVVTKMAGTFAYEDAIGGNIVQHGCHFRYRLHAKGTSYNESLERTITVVDSVDLAPGTTTFCITEAGIADDPKIHYIIAEPSAYESKENRPVTFSGRDAAAAKLAKSKAPSKVKKGEPEFDEPGEPADPDDILVDKPFAAATLPPPTEAPACKMPATDEDDGIPEIPKEKARVTYPCPLCNKPFSSKKVLADHQRKCPARKAAETATS
jgi:transcription termination factor NusA